MNDYDQRQYAWMVRVIEAATFTPASLKNTIDRLEALLQVLEERDSDWTAKFWDVWGELEMCYAMCVSDDRFALTEAEEKRVGEALQLLRALVALKLDSGHVGEN